MQKGTGNSGAAPAAAAPGAAAALPAASTDVSMGLIIQQMHVWDGVQRNKDKAHAEELAAKDKELHAQHTDLMQARLQVTTANNQAFQHKKQAEQLVMCMLLCSWLLRVCCLSSASSLQQFMQATKMQLQHEKHMQMQHTLDGESQAIVQDVRACKDIVTAITTANTQLEQVQEELKQAKQQITTEQAQLKQVREELKQAKQQVASQKQSIEKEVLYHIRPALY